MPFLITLSEIDRSSQLYHIILFYCLHYTYYIVYVFTYLLSVSSL